MSSSRAPWQLVALALLAAGCPGSRATRDKDNRDDWQVPPDVVLVDDGSQDGQDLPATPHDLKVAPPDRRLASESAPLCPNTICNTGESCATCPQDCPCASDKYCEKQSGTCKACTPHKSSGCTADEQCCQAADICKSGSCCRELGSACSGPGDCCNPSATCSAAGNCCMPVGTSCWDPKDCCGGHACTNGHCV